MRAGSRELNAFSSASISLIMLANSVAIVTAAERENVHDILKVRRWLISISQVECNSVSMSHTHRNDSPAGNS